MEGGRQRERERGKRSDRERQIQIEPETAKKNNRGKEKVDKHANTQTIQQMQTANRETLRKAYWLCERDK